MRASCGAREEKNYRRSCGRYRFASLEWRPTPCAAHSRVYNARICARPARVLYTLSTDGRFAGDFVRLGRCFSFYPEGVLRDERLRYVRVCVFLRWICIVVFFFLFERFWGCGFDGVYGSVKRYGCGKSWRCFNCLVNLLN